MALSDDQLERYSRHITLKEIGVRGQKKLLASKLILNYFLFRMHKPFLWKLQIKA